MKKCKLWKNKCIQKAKCCCKCEKEKECNKSYKCNNDCTKCGQFESEEV